MKEIWKPIQKYEDRYLISNLGKVFSLFSKRCISNRINKAGYIQIILHKKGENKTLLLHRVLGQTFIPNPLNLPQINHKNAVKTNNKLKNLEWVTQSFNTRHAYKMDKITRMLGEKHPKAILTNQKVLKIKTLSQNNDCLSYREIGKIFGVNKSTISDIITGKTWTHILI